MSSYQKEQTTAHQDWTPEEVVNQSNTGTAGRTGNTSSTGNGLINKLVGGSSSNTNTTHNTNTANTSQSYDRPQESYTSKAQQGVANVVSGVKGDNSAVSGHYKKASDFNAGANSNLTSEGNVIDPNDNRNVKYESMVDSVITPGDLNPTTDHHSNHHSGTGTNRESTTTNTRGSSSSSSAYNDSTTSSHRHGSGQDRVHTNPLDSNATTIGTGTRVPAAGQPIGAQNVVKDTTTQNPQGARVDADPSELPSTRQKHHSEGLGSSSKYANENDSTTKSNTAKSSAGGGLIGGIIGAVTGRSSSNSTGANDSTTPGGTTSSDYAGGSKGTSGYGSSGVNSASERQQADNQNYNTGIVGQGVNTSTNNREFEAPSHSNAAVPGTFPTTSSNTASDTKEAYLEPNVNTSHMDTIDSGRNDRSTATTSGSGAGTTAAGAGTGGILGGVIGAVTGKKNSETTTRAGEGTYEYENAGIKTDIYAKDRGSNYTATTAGPTPGVAQHSATGHHNTRGLDDPVDSDASVASLKGTPGANTPNTGYGRAAAGGATGAAGVAAYEHHHHNQDAAHRSGDDQGIYHKPAYGEGAFAGGITENPVNHHNTTSTSTSGNQHQHHNTGAGVATGAGVGAGAGYAATSGGHHQTSSSSTTNRGGEGFASNSNASQEKEIHEMDLEIAHIEDQIKSIERELEQHRTGAQSQIREKEHDFSGSHYAGGAALASEKRNIDSQDTKAYGANEKSLRSIRSRQTAAHSRLQELEQERKQVVSRSQEIDRELSAIQQSVSEQTNAIQNNSIKNREQFTEGDNSRTLKNGAVSANSITSKRQLEIDALEDRLTRLRLQSDNLDQRIKSGESRGTTHNTTSSSTGQYDSDTAGNSNHGKGVAATAAAALGLGAANKNKHNDTSSSNTNRDHQGYSTQDPNSNYESVRSGHGSTNPNPYKVEPYREQISGRQAPGTTSGKDDAARAAATAAAVTGAGGVGAGYAAEKHNRNKSVEAAAPHSANANRDYKSTHDVDNSVYPKHETEKSGPQDKLVAGDAQTASQHRQPYGTAQSSGQTSSSKNNDHTTRNVAAGTAAGAGTGYGAAAIASSSHPADAEYRNYNSGAYNDQADYQGGNQRTLGGDAAAVGASNTQSGHNQYGNTSDKNTNTNSGNNSNTKKSVNTDAAGSKTQKLMEKIPGVSKKHAAAGGAAVAGGIVAADAKMSGKSNDAAIDQGKSAAGQQQQNHAATGGAAANQPAKTETSANSSGNKYGTTNNSGSTGTGAAGSSNFDNEKFGQTAGKGMQQAGVDQQYAGYGGTAAGAGAGYAASKYGNNNSGSTQQNYGSSNTGSGTGSGQYSEGQQQQTSGGGKHVVGAKGKQVDSNQINDKAEHYGEKVPGMNKTKAGGIGAAVTAGGIAAKETMNNHDQTQQQQQQQNRSGPSGAPRDSGYTAPDTQNSSSGHRGTTNQSGPAGAPYDSSYASGKGTDYHQTAATDSSANREVHQASRYPESSEANSKHTGAYGAGAIGGVGAAGAGAGAYAAHDHGDHIQNQSQQQQGNASTTRSNDSSSSSPNNKDSSLKTKIQNVFKGNKNKNELHGTTYDDSSYNSDAYRQRNDETYNTGDENLGDPQHPNSQPLGGASGGALGAGIMSQAERDKYQSSQGERTVYQGGDVGLTENRGTGGAIGTAGSGDADYNNAGHANSKQGHATGTKKDPRTGKDVTGSSEQAENLNRQAELGRTAAGAGLAGTAGAGMATHPQQGTSSSSSKDAEDFIDIKVVGAHDKSEAAAIAAAVVKENRTDQRGSFNSNEVTIDADEFKQTHGNFMRKFNESDKAVVQQMEHAAQGQTTGHH